MVRFPAFQKAVGKTDVGDIDVPKYLKGRYNDQDIKNYKEHKDCLPHGRQSLFCRFCKIFKFDTLMAY